MAWAEQLVAQYGYAAIFFLLMLGIVGPLIPDETILVFAGILIHQGTLRPELTLASAYAGSVCGITLSYWIGRSGAKWFARYGKQQHRTHEWFERYGGWTLFFGYFVVGVRHFTALVAGTSQLEFPKFASFAYSGGLVWVLTFLSLGYFVGDSWRRWSRFVNGGLLGAALVVAVGGVIAYRLTRRH